MDMYNADGSQAQMCGNGIRCVAKYVYERGMTDKTTIDVETGAGVKTLWLNVDGGVVESVRVCMGIPGVRAVQDTGGRLRYRLYRPAHGGRRHHVECDGCLRRATRTALFSSMMWTGLTCPISARFLRTTRSSPSA